MGFNEKWISLLVICVTTVKYDVLINGAPGRIIQPERGNRQEDPISPYLFLICAKGFSSLMRKAEREGQIRRIKIARGYQLISHLFFVDNSILFYRARVSNWLYIQEVLKVYEKAYRQSVKKKKITPFFSSNTRRFIKDQIRDYAGLFVSTNPGTYLGLLSIALNFYRVVKFNSH